MIDPDAYLVDTICGPFDVHRRNKLRKVLDRAEARAEASQHKAFAITTAFEGRALDVRFGRYLLKYLDTRFRNTDKGKR